jgi:RNA polymerase sigma-70 factor (ECF subfamily)
MRRICLAEARRLLRDPEDAEEAVQEALVRAWRSIETCRAVHAPTGWLLQITRNESFRVLARRNRRRERELPGQADAHGAADNDLEGVLAAIALEQAIAPLPGSDRTLMRLRYLHDFSQAELARVLRVPEGTVKVRLFRNRARLRAAMERSR